MFKSKYIIWFSAATLLFSATSCDDMLEQAPVDLLATDNFYKTPSQCEQGVIGVYKHTQALDNSIYLHLSECRSANVWVEPISNALREYTEISTFRSDETLGFFNDVWNNLYQIIYNANVAIVKIEGCDFSNSTETFKNQLLGECYFLRGYAFLELARNFGNVPMPLKAVSPSEAKELAQSTPEEVFAQAIADLTEAKILLPEKANMKTALNASAVSQGRADKIAATAMLARANAQLGGWPYNNASAKAAAKAAAKEVIDYANSKNMYWAPNMKAWNSQFLANHFNDYSIFAIQHRAGEQMNYFVFNFCKGLPPSETGIRIFGNSIFVDKSLEYEFERLNANGEEDGRGEGWTTKRSYPEEANTIAYNEQWDNVRVNTYYTDYDPNRSQVRENTYYIKFYSNKSKLAALGDGFDESSVGHYYDWPVNFPVLRLEDMMLLYAEYLAEEGNTAEAMNLVNKIRTRAGADAVSASSKDQALKYVKRERRIELAMEGVRWYDQVRYGEWKETTIAKMNDHGGDAIDGIQTSNVVDGRYLHPIPETQLLTAPGLYKQNQGY